MKEFIIMLLDPSNYLPDNDHIEGGLTDDAFSKAKQLLSQIEVVGKNEDVYFLSTLLYDSTSAEDVFKEISGSVKNYQNLSMDLVNVVINIMVESIN